MVVKHHRKGKSETGKSGREAKKGATGIAAAYITRNKALKRLQVSLKDFRRLCILKGIHPRDPKKKKEGRDKTYYHVKDIAYLQYEPLLQHFRDLKVFLRKVHRAKVQHDATRISHLSQNRPVFTLHHLLRERYPTFQLAVNDLDDSLNLLSLFHQLPTTTLLRAFTPEYSTAISTLLHEYLLYVTHTHSLTKVFVSIKGMYYQAEINTQPVTWLMPHQFTQHLPTDVDYRVMFTFVQWYVTALRFVNFKLYHDANLRYPPLIKQAEWEQGKGLTALTIEQKRDTPTPQPSLTSTAPTPQPSKGKKGKVDQGAAQLQRKVDRVIRSLNPQTEGPTPTEDVEEEGGTDGAEDSTSFPSTDPPSAATVDYDKRRSLFGSCVFLLSREVPRLPLELTILSGGGRFISGLGVVGVGGVEGVTHVVMDRPRVQGERMKGVHYVQPQWVFDSFNLRVLAPVSLYEVGKLCPPHLSPFVVDDEAEGGYEPEQRRIQRGWVEGVKDVGEALREGGVEEEEEEGEEMDEETRFEMEMDKERRGISSSSTQQKEEEEEEEVEVEEDDEEEEEDDEDEDEDEEEEEEEDEGEKDLEGEEEEVKAVPPPPSSALGKVKGKAKVSEDEESRELAKVMMGKKAARLYQRIQFGLARKKAANDALRKKKELADQREREESQGQHVPAMSRTRKGKRGAAANEVTAEDEGQTRAKRKRVGGV